MMEDTSDFSDSNFNNFIKSVYQFNKTMYKIKIVKLITINKSTSGLKFRNVL